MRKRPCFVRSVAFCGERIKGNASAVELSQDVCDTVLAFIHGRGSDFFFFHLISGLPSSPPFLFSYPITSTAAPSSRPSRKSASASFASSSL